MTLETMEPDPDWDPEEHGEAVELLASLDGDYRFLVWGDDGCVDCQELLPAFGAALEAAGVPDDRVERYPVERLPGGRKRGPKVPEYAIQRIPTVIVEREGEELLRFVEAATLPIPEYIVENFPDEVEEHTEARQTST